MNPLTMSADRPAPLPLCRWATEHRKDPLRGRLRRNVPTLGEFFTALPLTEALNVRAVAAGIAFRFALPCVTWSPGAAARAPF